MMYYKSCAPFLTPEIEICAASILFSFLNLKGDCHCFFPNIIEYTLQSNDQTLTENKSKNKKADAYHFVIFEFGPFFLNVFLIYYFFPLHSFHFLFLRKLKY